MRATHKADALSSIHMYFATNDVFNPRATSVYQTSSSHRLGAVGPFKRDLPNALNTARLDHLCAGHNLRATVRRITGVQHNKPRILDPTIRILIGAGKLTLQRSTNRICRQIHHPRSRQYLTSTKRIIQKQAKSHEPCRTAPLHPRHEKRQ